MSDMNQPETPQENHPICFGALARVDPVTAVRVCIMYSPRRTHIPPPADR
jgi:hypothetical protein